MYTITGPDTTPNDGTIDSTATTLTVVYSPTVASPTVRFPWSSGTPSAPVPYQIFRQPVRSSAAPLQLPDGIVVDLLYSGSGTAPGLFISSVSGAVPPQPWPMNWSANWATNPPAPYNPVISFTPGGSVGHLGTTTLMRPTGPIYLLLGRREFMPDAALIKGGANDRLPEDKNIFDSDLPQPANLYLQNFWITIGYQTGLVTVTENAVNLGPIADATNYLNNARAIARTSQGIGGQ